MTHAPIPVAASKNLLDIEIARPGKWRLASGELEVTARDLDDAARFAARPGARPGYLKIGHTDTRFMASDGEPALGWLHNIRVEEDDEGHVLKGDLYDVPDWLAEAIPRHWPDRSMEGYAGYEHDGQKYGLVVDGLALLGVTPPGMSSIKSLRDLPTALGVAASGALEPNGTRIVASFGDPQSPASEAEEPTTKGAGMTLAKYREALDELPDDASEDDLRAALVAAGLSMPSPEGTPVAAAAAKPGTMHVDASAWNEREDRIKRLEAADAKRRVDERDEIIRKAVKDGKFAPFRRDHWVRLWDADPEGTRQVIDGLAKNVMPVMASGYAGEGVEADEEYSALFGAPDARKAG